MTKAASRAEAYRRWICAQHVKGYRIKRTEGSRDGGIHLRLEGDTHLGEVNFYVMDDDSEIVEMRITRLADDESVFFLHFMMADLTRAQELFCEMRDALVELAQDRRVDVLLCCTCGITTTMFASKMSELSETLGLGYDVHARSLDAAIASGETPDVVMLAPQVAYERARVAKAFPDAVVFAAPGKVFGSYDAVGGLRVIANALNGHRSDGPATDPSKIPDDLVWPGRIMVVSSALGARQSSFQYRVFDHGQTVLTGGTTKRAFDFRDIEDLLAGVRMAGVDVGSLDAIGIAVPGVVDQEAVSLLVNDVHGYDLGGHIREVYGVPVYLDNDANAAAVG